MNQTILEKCGNIVNREVVLWGDYEEIEIFLNKYSSLINVKAVVTSFETDIEERTFEKTGLSVYLFENYQFTNELIVICGRSGFGFRQKYLRHKGMEEYRDYISSELVESMVFSKTLLLYMGTSLVGQVYQFITNSDSLNKNYSMIFYHERELKEGHVDRTPIYLHIARCCDVYVVASCQEKKYYLKKLKMNQLGKDCKIITISDYGFGGYFPQIINDRDVISNYLLRERERLDMSYETLALSRVDKEMEELCNEGVLVADIVKKLMNKSYFEKTYILNYFRDEIQRIKLLEIDDNIRLGNFIELHAKECLCRNLNEWNEPVVTYVAKELCHILGLSDDLPMDQEEREKMIEESSGSELLIYPCVAEALDLNETIQNKKYKVVTYYDVKYMSAEEYIQYLATYLCKAIDLLRYTGMDQTLLEEE